MRISVSVSGFMAAALVAVTMLNGTAARAGVIYQAFNEKFRDVEGKLDELAGIGYQYVQVSPPQKSADLEVWWARYQPIDFQVLESPLGNEADLRRLIDRAHSKGLKILVDVVLNHMADPRFHTGQLQYPEFSWRDFHYQDSRPCISNYRDRYEVTHYWLCDHRLNHNLPDLDTSSPYVRSVLAKYLHKLIALGADGFRFDAMKHVEPEYYEDLVTRLPRDKVWFYGEVIGETLDESYTYTPYMPVTDFHLLRVMIGAFGPGGDLRNLIHPESYGAALPGRDAVVFARNHDTVMHSGFFNFSDYQDAMLANAFILARGVGTPMIYRDDFNQGVVAAGVKFYNRTKGKGTWVRPAGEVCGSQADCEEGNLLFVERGQSAVAVINKAAKWIDVGSARFAGLQEGCYQELSYGFPVRISRGGDGSNWVSAWGTGERGGFRIGPRTALYLTKASSQACDRLR